MAKELKKWNGRAPGKYQRKHIYVAAYTKIQAREIVGIACDLYRPLGASEINEYYSPCWGNTMEGIEPTEPCVYISAGGWGSKPIQIFPKQKKKK